MFEATTRPLSGDERERLERRCAELEHRVAAEEREQALLRRGAALGVLGFSGVFAAIAVVNLVVGSRPLTIFVAVFGAVAFAAIAFSVSRRYEHSFAERRELALTRDALIQDTVRVYALIADAAIVLHEPGDEDSVVGYLLRVSETEVVHVELRHCGALDPRRLPTTHLRIEWAAPLGVIGAQALGERIDAAQRCPLKDPAALEPHIVAELVACPTTLEQLALHLTGSP